MNTTNTKETTITTKNQAAQAQVTQPTLFRQDIKETLRSWLKLDGIFDGKFYSEISYMLRMAVTSDYLNELDMQNLPEPEVAGSELLQRTVVAFKAFNEVFAEEVGITIQGLDIPDELTPYQVAKLMMSLCHIRLVVDRDRYECNESGLQGPDRYAVMLYVADKSSIYDGESDIGTYTGNFRPLIRILSSYSMEGSYLAFDGFVEEVEFWLRIFAKKASLSYFHGFMPLENGVLNCRTKELLPFSPEYVFDECTYPGVYENGEDGPVIRIANGTDESVDDWIKSVASGNHCEELRRVLAECV